MDFLPDENRRFRELERVYWEGAADPDSAATGRSPSESVPTRSPLGSPFCAGLVLSAATPLGVALVTVFVGAAIGLLVAVIGATTATTSLLMAAHRG